MTHQVGDDASSRAGDAGIAEPASGGHALDNSSRVVDAAVCAGPLRQILWLPPPGLLILEVQLSEVQQMSTRCWYQHAMGRGVALKHWMEMSTCMTVSEAHFG